MTRENDTPGGRIAAFGENGKRGVRGTHTRFGSSGVTTGVITDQAQASNGIRPGRSEEA